MVKKIKLQIILSIMLCAFISTGKAQSWEENLNTKGNRNKISQSLAELSKSTLNIVITDEQTKEGQAIMKAFDKYWTYSKYKFISTDEFKTTYKDEGTFFLTTMKVDIAGMNTNSGFVILKGGNGIIMAKDGTFKLKEGNENLTLKYKNLVYGFNYESSIGGYNLLKYEELYVPIYISRFNTLLGNLVDAMEVTKKTDDKILIFYNNTTLDSLKGKTLFIDKSIDLSGYKYYNSKNLKDAKNDQTNYEDKMKTDYSKALGIPKENIILLEKEEIIKLFETANKDYIFMLPSTFIFDYKGKNLVNVTYKIMKQSKNK